MQTRSFNPIFFEQTRHGEQRMYDISSRLVKDRVIFLDSEINSDVASAVASVLLLLDKEEPKDSASKGIDLWINSPGGAVQGFFAIYDMINNIKSPVSTYCIGEAYSAAALLLACGTKGHRYIMPHARVMIHQIQVDGLGGSGKELEINSKECKLINKELLEVLAKHTGKSCAKVRRDTIHDKYFSASEAVKYGLADKILKPKKAIPELVGAKKVENTVVETVEE